MAVFLQRQLCGHWISTDRRDTNVPNSMTLRSPYIICSLCQQYSRLTDFAVTTCQLLISTAVFPYHWRCSHRVSTDHRDGSIPTSVKLRSPCVTCSPRQQYFRLTDFTVTKCHLHDGMVVFPSQGHYGHIVSSTHSAGSLSASVTLRSPDVIRSAGSQYSHVTDFPVTTCHLHNTMAVFPSG
jgi:hypothetical protein